MALKQIKSLILSLESHKKKYDKAKYWLKNIFVISVIQIIVQGVAFLSGILVIRLLPVEEYALYTIANTMLGTMIVLADVGVTNGVMAQGGKVWLDKQKLGAVLATGLDLRHKFAFISLLITIPVLFYFLLHKGASWLTSFLIALSLIPVFYGSIIDSLLTVIPKLHQDIYSLLKNQLFVCLGRLFFSAILIFIFPLTFVAILASGVPQILGNSNLKKIVENFIDKKQELDFNVRNDLMIIVKRVLPTSIYFTFSGQISIWLISIFGTTMALAQLGAISKISAIFSLFNAFLSFVIIPRLARLPNNPEILLKKYLKTLLMVIVFHSILVLLISFFSKEILWVLGEEYSYLNNELILSVIGTSISIFAGVSYSFYSTRGWIIDPLIVIVVDLCAIISGIFIFSVSNILGVLELTIYIASILSLMNVLYSLIKIKSIGLVY